VIHETTIAQLKRFKDDAREVTEGFECGILLDRFNDVKEGDVLEAFETREVERTDLATSVAAGDSSSSGQWLGVALGRGFSLAPLCAGAEEEGRG
jgi:hypothetical protein